MGLNTRRNESFSATTKNPQIEGDDVVFIKGGSTVIGERWIQFDDLRIDVGDLIDNWIGTRARRIFNKKNGVLNVLIALTKNQDIEVIPSISLNQTSSGSVSAFESISNRLPLVLVKLTQDGTNDLSSYVSLTKEDFVVYKGYGNFTLQGEQGYTGPQGDTGLRGILGDNGDRGDRGEKGIDGHAGIKGYDAPPGATGVAGVVGESLYRRVVSRQSPPSAEFSGSPVSGENPLTVVFTNLSTGDWDTVYWNFGDGNTSTQESPTHTYADVGTYTVTLIIEGVEGTDTEVKYGYITVTETCYIQNVLDSSTPEGIWQNTVDSQEDNVQNVVGSCS